MPLSVGEEVPVGGVAALVPHDDVFELRLPLDRVDVDAVGRWWVVAAGIFDRCLLRAGGVFDGDGRDGEYEGGKRGSGRHFKDLIFARSDARL